MIKALLPLLLLFTQLCFSQEYYTFNSDTLYSLQQVQLRFIKVSMTIPKNFIVRPVIYHKIIKRDSIINFIEWRAQKNDSGIDKSKFELTYKQDSVFLLLNKKLPEFKLKDLNGKEFSSAQLKGKPALINYWAIYCSPCVAEIPQLNHLKDKYGGKMNFIALTENTCKDDTYTLMIFLEKHPFNYLVLQDAEQYKRDLKIDAIPVNIFIDENGIVKSIQKNFPVQSASVENDANNYFVKIIEKLVQH